MKKKFKKIINEPLWRSFYYAFQGMRHCIETERNMLIHFCAFCLVIFCGFFFQISSSEWIICLLLCSLVMSAELTNTAVETTIDLCMPDIHPKAKLAKDTAAGAVLVVAITAFIIGLIIFLPKVITFIESLL